MFYNFTQKHFIFRTESNIDNADEESNHEDKSTTEEPVMVTTTNRKRKNERSDDERPLSTERRGKKNPQTQRQELLEEKMLERLSDRRDEDPDRHFLLSLLPQISQLNQDQKNYLYIEFLQSIQKAKSFSFPTSNNTTLHTTRTNQQQHYQTPRNVLYYNETYFPTSSHDNVPQMSETSSSSLQRNFNTSQLQRSVSTPSSPFEPVFDFPSPTESTQSLHSS